MLLEIGAGTALVAISATLGFIVSKKINSANLKVYITQAKAKAKAIEYEAGKILQEANLEVKNIELDAKKKYDTELQRMEKTYEAKKDLFEKKEQELNHLFKDEIKIITEEKEELKKDRKILNSLFDEAKALKIQEKENLNKAISLLENSAGLTKDEAREVVLQNAEDTARTDIAHIVRKHESEAKKEGRKKANYIIAQATTRFAGDFAAERLINVITIKDDELKGRIIGKEGRNIKSLEMLLGVDIIIDDTPNAILVSSFNLYRREIAKRVIELLVEDGRIQPARIEEIHKKVKEEFEDKLLEAGEEIVLDLGLNGIHPELLKLIGRLKFRASYGQNALGHSLEVAHLAGIIAAECGGDENLAKRAGILHDIGKALTQDFSGSHVDLGADICRRYKEDPVVINAIYAHHGHEEALSVECAAVCTADTLSAARPGARREVLESFLKRVQDIEDIASDKKGVRNVFAINAGREIRVIANAQLVSDDEAILLAKEIAKEIEEKVQYPGDIKVNVIREIRAVDYAR